MPAPDPDPIARLGALGDVLGEEATAAVMDTPAIVADCLAQPRRAEGEDGDEGEGEGPEPASALA